MSHILDMSVEMCRSHQPIAAVFSRSRCIMHVLDWPRLDILQSLRCRPPIATGSSLLANLFLVAGVRASARGRSQDTLAGSAIVKAPRFPKKIDRSDVQIMCAQEVLDQDTLVRYKSVYGVEKAEERQAETWPVHTQFCSQGTEYSVWPLYVMSSQA